MQAIVIGAVLHRPLPQGSPPRWITKIKDTNFCFFGNLGVVLPRQIVEAW